MKTFLFLKINDRHKLINVKSLQIMWSVLSCDVTIYIDTIDTGLKIVLDSDGDNDTADNKEHETYWGILIVTTHLMGNFTKHLT